jgi:hypothetical protein
MQQVTIPDIELPDSIDAVAFAEFVRFMAAGLRHGEREYGPLSFLEADIRKEIAEELRDLATWGFLQWLKMLLITRTA